MMELVAPDFSQQNRAMHIKQTHISTARPNLLKEHASPTHGLTGRIKHENTTSCIVHLAGSANFENITSNKLCSGLTGSCFESPNDTIHITVVFHAKRKTVHQMPSHIWHICKPKPTS